MTPICPLNFKGIAKMTTKRTWQKLEERICERFGGKRTPFSGSNSQHGTSADCIKTDFPEYYIEIKLREKFVHHTIFRGDVEAPAKKEGRIPLLITHKKNAKTSALVTLRLDDFLEIVKK